MSTTQASPALETASAPGCRYSIEYSPSAMDEIRRAAVEGFLRVRHGGIEVGGVLFGSRAEDRVAILASRPIECEHLAGPSFNLSARDIDAIQVLLERSATEPDLAGMEAVGWYHTRTRGEIELTEADEKIHGRFFGEPWQVAMLVKPEEFGTARAILYFGKAAGPEIAIPLPRRLPRPCPEPAGPPQPTASQPPAPAAPSPNLQAARYAAAARFRSPSVRWRAWLSGIAALAFILLLWGARPHANNRFWLRAADEDGLLRIDWNRDAAVLGSATGGKLSIRDGTENVSIELDAAMLRNGNISYQRRSPNVSVQLAVPTRDGQLVAASRFIGQPPKPVARRNEPPAQAPESRQDEKVRRVKRAPPARQTAQPKKEQARAAPKQPAPALRSRPVRIAELRNQARSAPPMIPEPKPMASSAHLPPVIAPAPKVPPPEPARADLAPAVMRAYSGPRAGRIIWTGRLREGDLLEIERGRVSRGSLTGQLPPVPVHVRVHSAELKNDRMVVYGPERPAEEPGASNGWNRTEYRWNRKRSQDLTVVEPPTPGNDWGKIVVRGERRETALIVIDWEAIGKSR